MRGRRPVCGTEEREKDKGVRPREEQEEEHTTPTPKLPRKLYVGTALSKRMQTASKRKEMIVGSLRERK